MFTSTAKADPAKAGQGEILIPLIRAAATIGFVIAPYSLGFVIIAVSEQLIRSIMVGEDPEMLVSELQNQFPDASIEVAADYDAGLVAQVVELIEQPEAGLPVDIRGLGFQGRVRDALKSPCEVTANYTFLAEQIEARKSVRL